MLVLSRKKGERVVVGDSVTVTVLELKGNVVKLGFAAPAEVPVHREEVIWRTDMHKQDSTALMADLC